MNKEALSIFSEIAQKLLQAERENGVIKPISTEALFEKLDLNLSPEACSDSDWKQSITNLVLQTPRTSTKKFFNQLFGGRNTYATIGDLLAVLLNNSLYTYKVGGAMIGVEKVLIREISHLLGYDPETSDGLTVPGGSMCNMMAMIMARDFRNSEIPQTGVQTKMIYYTSEDSHYSIPKNASFIGIGRNQIRLIPTNRQGVMDTETLQEIIEKDLAENMIPTMINATAGTTVLGAFDPISTCADIAEKYGVWLHVDGAYCGAVLYSNKYKHLIDGVHRADSFCFNAHKMLNAPISCSIFLAKEDKMLYQSFNNEANYLYQTHDDYFNPGKISMQCGRRNDALKLWTLWKAIGTNGLGKMIDHQFALAKHARSYIESHPDYILYSFENSISVCFNYKNIPANELCNQLYQEGLLMVGYGDFRGEQFVRLVTVNAGNEVEDIEAFFNIIETMF